VVPGLAVALLAACIVAAGVGAYRLPPMQVVGAVLDRLGVPGLSGPDELGLSVLWQVRFPRVVLASLVGASLACAGALMQGIFGNPLAEPGIVGVSAGAAVGAALAIVLGVSVLGPFGVAAVAFVAGLLTTLLVYVSARRDGRTEVVTLVLTGIAINALAGAALGLLLFVSDDEALRSITFWNLGSVGSATWRSVGAVAPLTLIGVAVAPRFARRLDVLALGERPARHLGVDVERLRLVLIVVVALLSASAVAVAGVISFVGLVVPHLVRLLVGPGHRILLPASALGGAVLVVLADLVARTAAAPAEVPLGVLTAALGGPFFFWLLRRTRARQGGWA
jgi:iron complex transport system permease protein